MSGTLSDRLECAMIRSAEGTDNWFIPHDQLNQILDRRSVTDEVITLFNDETPQQLEQLVDRILGQGKISQVECRKIFAVLVIIGQARSIKQFIDNNISDADIPLKTSPEDGFKITAFHIKQETTSPRITPKGWSNTNYRNFLDYQWCVNAPVFTRDKSHDDNIPVLGEQTIFPWIPDHSLKDQNHKTGHSEVRPVKIHESHHDFANTDSPSVFALKKLHKYVNKSEDKAEVSEIEILRKYNLKDETNLIQLLTAYCWNDDYYLIFPWANGGSLEDLWESNPNQSLTKEFVTWVSDQCHGVAKGLYQIHERKLSDWSRERLGGRLEDPNVPGDIEFGLHGDIKPANILWFKHPKESIGEGVLKICDFGLAQFHSRETHMRSEHNNWIGCSRTYRPPEWVPMSESGRIRPYSRKADIWALGCVFLEFVTWILHGKDGIEDFSEARTGDDRPQTRGQPYCEDIFFQVDAETSLATVKKSVKQWIKKLHHHDRCSQYLHDFLDLIEESMLVASQDQREKCDVVKNQLCKLSVRCCTSDDYAIRPSRIDLNGRSPDVEALGNDSPSIEAPSHESMAHILGEASPTQPPLNEGQGLGWWATTSGWFDGWCCAAKRSESRQHSES